jgi:hypothetical protein
MTGDNIPVPILEACKQGLPENGRNFSHAYFSASQDLTISAIRNGMVVAHDGERTDVRCGIRAVMRPKQGNRKKGCIK